MVQINADTTEKNLDASKIIKQNVAPLIKGGGGQDASNLDKVIEVVKALI